MSTYTSIYQHNPIMQVKYDGSCTPCTQTTQNKDITRQHAYEVQPEQERRRPAKHKGSNRRRCINLQHKQNYKMFH